MVDFAMSPRIADVRAARRMRREMDRLNGDPIDRRKSVCIAKTATLTTPFNPSPPCYRGA
jgi:hypothetical protein